MYSSVVKSAATNDEVMHCIEVCKSLTVLVHFFHSVASHHFFIPGAALANLGIEITHEDVGVSLRILTHDALRSIMEVIFGFFISIICWCIALDDIHLYFLLVCLEGCCDDS